MNRTGNWIDEIYYPFFTNEKEITIFTGVESVYYDYMLSCMVIYEKRQLKETLFVDLRNNVGYTNKKASKYKDKLPRFVITPSITFSTGIFMMEVNSKKRESEIKTFYTNLGEKYFTEHENEFFKKSHVVIFSDGNDDTALGLANKVVLHNKQCIIITPTQKKILAQVEGGSDFKLEQGNTVNEELLLSLKEVLSRDNKLYLTRILAKNNVVSHLTLLNQLQYVNVSEYEEINNAYKSNNLYSIAFSKAYIEHYSNENNKANLSKYAIDIVGAIKLVREFDPFNFDMLKNLYQFINIDLCLEFDNIREALISDLISDNKSEMCFESQEGKVVEKIRKFQKINSSNVSYTIIKLEIKALYESFLQCFEERFSFGVIQLGVLLQAQATNFGMLDVVTDVVAKKKFTLNKVEGKKTSELLLHIEKIEKLLAPTIYPPNDILCAFPNLEDDIDRIISEKQIENYIYSNLIGYYSVTSSENLSSETRRIMEMIYSRFLKIYDIGGNEDSIFYSGKILNNLAIYEQKYRKGEGMFTEELLNKVVSNADKCHIILLYNAIGIVLSNNRDFPNLDELLLIYEEKYKMKLEDDFYIFYDHCLKAYRKNKDKEYPYKGVNMKMIPQIYKGQFLEKEIKQQVKCKKTSNKNNYLFVDNQFWFNE